MSRMSTRDAARIAAAFELAHEQVLEDADLAAAWQHPEDMLAELLQQRHHWDASMAPVYLFWLRGDSSGYAH